MFRPLDERSGPDGKDGALMGRDELRRIRFEEIANDCKASRYQKYAELLGVCWGLLPTETDKSVQNALETTIEVVAHKMGFEIIKKWMGDLKETETGDETPLAEAESEGGADE